MAHPDSLFDLFKPVLWLVLASFLVGVAGVLALAGSGALEPSGGRAELAGAMAAADHARQDS